MESAGLKYDCFFFEELIGQDYDQIELLPLIVIYLVTTVCISADNAAIVLVATAALVVVAVVFVVVMASSLIHASDKLFR